MRAGFVPLVLALLAGCGPRLGSYQVEDVLLVSADRPGQIDNDDNYTGPERQLIRIRFTSTTDLEAATEGGDLYVHGDFCPIKDEYQLGIIGPFYGDQPRLLSWRVTSYNRSHEGRVRMAVDTENRHPPRDPKTGRYVYTAYLIPSAPGDQFSDGYDLRRQTGDLCLRIDHPGYYLIPSRSKVFKIDGRTVRKILRSS